MHDLWRDVTPFEVTDGTTLAGAPWMFEAKIETLDVVVTRQHHMPGKWFWRSQELGVRAATELKSLELKDAQDEALSLAIKMLRDRIESDRVLVIALTYLVGVSTQ